MTLPENIQSNFVRALENEEHRIITYATIFFILAFIGCLLAFWVYEYRGNKCVFFGNSCCFTSLQNRAKQTKINETVMLQKDTLAGWSPTGGLEHLTFEYGSQINSSLGDEENNNTFFVDLHNAKRPSDVTPYNNNCRTGFCYSPASSGISFYLGDYGTKSGCCWEQSHLLINHGLSNFINSNISGMVEIFPNDKGFNYIIKSENSLEITTDTSPSGSYFKGFTSTGDGSGGTIITRDIPVNSATYNPMIDFNQAKENSTKFETSAEASHGCVDPSSKNLPSCKNPRVDGKYIVLSNQASSLSSQGDLKTAEETSKNCSHSYQIGGNETSKQGDVGFVDSLISKGSNVVTKLVGNDEKDCKTGGSKCGVEMSLGTESFDGNPATDSFLNSYVSDNIFCGGSSDPKNPGPMYDSNIAKNHDVTSGIIRDNMRASTFPQAKKDGEKYILGFN